MMCIQTPGSLVWAASLAAREGVKGWSVWGVLVVTACLQGTLLVMAIYFEYFGPDSKPNGSASEGPDEQDDQYGAFSPGGREVSTREPVSGEQPSEETPLLQSQ